MGRLSRREYEQTLGDLFGSELVSSVAAVGQFPNDVIVDSVEEFKPLYALEHVDAITEVALELSKKLTTQRADLNRIAPTCIGTGLDAGSIPAACLRDFIASLGLKVLRRPLSPEQVDGYAAVYSGPDPEIAKLPPVDRLQLVIARMLQAPDLVFHHPVAREAPAAGRARVDGYTVASRLSYRLAETTPDPALLALAQSGELYDAAVVHREAARLLDSPRGRERVRGLFNHWLRLDRVLAPNPVPMGRVGLAIDDASRNQLRTDLVDETLDFVEHVAFDARGDFRQLLTSPLAFPSSDAMAKILGLTPGVRGSVSVGNARRGLLMRPAVLVTAREREAPILRGITVRTRLLCDTLPPPPANAAQVADAVAGTLDPTDHSTRELATIITGGAQCTPCHSRLNPLGYALGHFGPLGEWRDSEKVYGADGQLKHDFPIDSKVVNADVATPADTVADQSELADLVNSSAKGKACLTVYAFRFTRMRYETDADACQLGDVESLLRAGRPLTEAFVEAVAAEDIFWKGASP